jgi:predicted dehydrogenase
MATSLAECDRMIETCRRTGAKLAINQPSRFNKLYVRTREIILSPAFGDLFTMTAVSGNNGMAMNGVHVFEGFQFITGETFSEVSAWFSPEQPPNPRGAEFEDHAGAMRAVTSSGKRFYLECGADQGHGQIIIYGGRYGQLHVNHLTGEMALFMRRPEDRDLPTTRWLMPTTTETFRLEPVDVVEVTKAVLRALLDGAGYVDGAGGRLAVEILVAANLSNEKHGAPVKLNGRLPKKRTFSWA